MKKIGFISAAVLLLAVIAFSGCKKDKHTEPQPNTPVPQTGNLMVFHNASLANSSDALQAVYRTKNVNAFCSFYGSFKSDGTPDKLKEVTICRNDTTIKMFLDSTLNIKTMFFTVKGVKDSVVLFFTHTDTTITVSSAAFHWANGTHKIKTATKIKRINNTLLSNNIFRLATGNSVQGSPDPYLSQLMLGLNGIVVVTPVLAAVGALVGAVVGTLLAPAIIGECIVVGILTMIPHSVSSSATQTTTSEVTTQNTTVTTESDYPSITQDPDFSDLPASNPITFQNISSPPTTTDQNITSPPSSDLANTEIANNYIGYGTSDFGPSVYFTANCSGQASTYINNIRLEVEMDAGRTNVLSAVYHTNYSFAWADSTGAYNYSNYGPYGGQSVLSFSRSGSSVIISWNGIWGGTDYFSGTIYGNTILGTFYFNVGYGCNTPGNNLQLASAPVSVQLIN
jgi:hypothetical protein